MPPAKEQSLVSIDIARAIAAFGVFYYHQHIGSMLSQYTGISWLQYTDTFGATFAVPLFFLISGYCIHLSNIKYIKADEPLPVKAYYIRRFRRLYPPYAAALLLSIAVALITQPGYHLSLADTLVHIFLLQGFTVNYFTSINVVLWTISVEVAFYIIYPVFYYLRRKYLLDKALLATLAVSVISITCFSFSGNNSYPAIYFVLNIWFSWCSGAYLADKVKLGESNLSKPVYKIIYAVILVAFILFKVAGFTKYVIIDYQLNILVWTAPLVLLLRAEGWLSSKNNLVIEIAAKIGLSSYSLYLLHEPLIALKNYCAHAFLPQKLHQAGVVAGIIIIPFIAWFSYKYIEKPFMARRPEAIVNV